MSKKDLLANSIIFSFIFIIANYLVQFRIDLGFMQIPLGVFVYPFSFLMTDILSEKYLKRDILKVINIAILISFIPTIIMANFRIAFASLATFYIVQIIDVSIFHYLREKYFNLWWLRNNVSTIISQTVDSVLFFTLAFSFVLPFDVIVKIILGNISVKVILALLDTPIFYLFAVKKINI